MRLTILSCVVLLTGICGCKRPPNDGHHTAPKSPRDDSGGAAVGYHDVAVDHGLGTTLRHGRGVSFTDLNGDGHLDLLVIDSDARIEADNYGRSKVFINDGTHSFVETDIGIHPDHLVSAWSGSFADYDNDGDPDLVIAAGGYSNPSSLSLYENQMDVSGQFVDRSANLGLSAADQQPANWWGVSWADYDNDGLLDLVATRVHSTARLFRNLGSGRFADVTLEEGVRGPSAVDSKNPVWFDFDRDGDQDLYLAGIRGDAFFENRHPDGFLLRQDLLNLGPSPFTFAAAAADFNQDGWEDLYLGRWHEQDYVYMNNTDGTFTRHGRDVGLDVALTRSNQLDLTYENTMGMSVIDLFDDGFPDVFIGTGDPSRAAADILFCNDGAGRFTRCTEVLFAADDPQRVTRGHGMVQGDLDGDCRYEFFLNLGGHSLWDLSEGEDTREYGRLFDYYPGAEDVLETAAIELRGTVGNRDAIGARITVHGERTSYYTIHSSQGFQSQHALSPVVFLGGEGPYPVEIEWPAGGITTASIRAGERLQVVEPDIPLLRSGVPEESARSRMLRVKRSRRGQAN